MNQNQEHVTAYMKEWLADQDDVSLDEAWDVLKDVVLDSLGDI